MKEEEFQSLVDNLISQKKGEDIILEEEMKRHWREILNQTYLFDRLDQEIVVLKTVTLQQLRDWFKQEYLGDNQRKLSVQIVGMGNEGAVAPGNSHGIRCLSDPEQTNSKPILNILEFKNSLKALPYNKVIS